MRSVTSQKRHGLVAALVCLFLFAVVFVKTAWLHEDYWILPRSVEQLYAGNGLVWNPHERLQIYTSSISVFLVAAGRLFTQDYFVIYASLSVFFNALALALLAMLLRDSRKWCAAVLLLTISHAYMDYTTSGRFNFFGHAILVAFLLAWREIWENRNGQRRGTGLLALAALAGLAPLFRHDFTLFVFPPALYALWMLRGETTLRSKLWAAALLVGPGALWSLFALFHFGQLLPVSAYHRVFTEQQQITFLQYGFMQYAYIVINDFPTPLVIVAGLTLLVRGSRPDRALAAGMGIFLFYIFYVGGDNMGGRLFTYSYLLGVVALVTNWERISDAFPQNANLRRSQLWRSPFPLAAGAVVWSLVSWHTPLMDPFPYKGEGHLTGVGGIDDKRSDFHESSNVGAYLDWRLGKADIYPDDDLARIGVVLRRANVTVIHSCNIGAIPFFARLDQKFIDVAGYSDFLQARLPMPKTRRSTKRRLPKGYLDSIAEGEALIENPELNEYYRKIRLVTQSDDLFSAERLLAIAQINLTTMPLPLEGQQLSKFTGKHPLVCPSERSWKDVLKHLDENIENLDAEALNKSDLSF